MAGDTDNPRIWLGADVYVGAVGSTAPTDTTTALDAAFKALGLLSEDGMTEKRDQSSDDYYAWGGVLVRTVRSKFKRTFVVTALEDNATVFALVNPGSTAATATGTTTRTVKNPTVNPQAFVFEMRDGDVTRRIVVPKGEVTEVGDVKYSDSDITGFELTITVYPASDGTLYKDITDDPAAAAA
jgi:hypothetical protein